MKKLLFTLLLVSFLFSPLSSAKAAEPVRILLIPGHDNQTWGAQYGNVKEAAMNLAVASRIFDILKKDKRFEVFITRDIKGYTKEFADYFSSQKEEIQIFKENAKKETQLRIDIGSFIKKLNPPHNKVSKDTAIKLYGFNKWANENKMDAVIHVHFNDYQRKNKWTVGTRTGFAIYMPEVQMVNSHESVLLAANIFEELKKKYDTSNYKRELKGLVPDQTLIALGANGTLSENVRSVLIEYGYIYEKKFRNYTTRHQAYADMANLTATGIKDHFFEE